MMSDDFHRLAKGLRAAIVDFDYWRTRKLLDPNWDGYTMPKGHDFINTDADLADANILTSQHRDNPDMHRIVLDLDYGVTFQHSVFTATPRLVLTRDLDRMWSDRIKFLVAALPPRQVRASAPSKGVLNLDIYCLYALIPSTTDGHYHLILDVNLPWNKYSRLLQHAAAAGIIEHGYADASIRRGFSAIRPPWIRKPTPSHSTNPTTARPTMNAPTPPVSERGVWTWRPPRRALKVPGNSASTGSTDAEP